MAQEICSFSSSSTQTCSYDYDVFVSFRGEDTRYKFTDHLFAALDRSGIRNFKDNRKLGRGKDIWTELEKAIQTSRIAVIVFSKNFANSRWCLEELAKIMECKRNLQQIVLPVFYEVDPSHLRNHHKGSLEKVFADYEKRYGQGKVAIWRDALIEAASLSGFDSQNGLDRFEANFIMGIIEAISSQLNKLSHLTDAPYPVGIESRVQELNKLLRRGSCNVCMVGILGIGGIGKTTIAKAIYHQLQRNFDASCFLENVRGDSKHPKDLICLQERILSSIHANDDIRDIRLVDHGTTVIKNIAWCKRVLVVLDDVDHQDQLDKLAIRRAFFQPGSIIIITTRDESLLKLAEVDETYVLEPLNYRESLQLLCWHAFKKDCPSENFVELSKEVISYAKGLPLALKVLGSFLSDKRADEWKGTLKKLREMPHAEIQEKLIVSFDSLSDTQQELFLDIACFFVGMDKNNTFKILQDSNLILEADLGVLVRQCLVTIDCWNRLTMHDMIRDMGREVVRKQSSTEPGERSRLWFHRDVLDVLKYHSGTKKVEGIMLNSPEDNNLQVDSKAFTNMHRLRVLQLNYACLEEGNFQCPSKRLRYLEWYGFPMESIPPDLYMENLVAIYMPYSSLIELWTGTKILKKLKFLDVSHSYHLRTTPDFSGITNLEVLVLNNCTSLVEVDESVMCLNKLVTLDLEDCKNLEKLPQDIYNLKFRVNLSGCTKLDMVPRGEFNSSFKLWYSLHISSEVPLTSCDFISNLPQHKDFIISGGGIIASATSCVQAKPRCSASTVVRHHPSHSQPPLKKLADLVKVDGMPLELDVLVSAKGMFRLVHSLSLQKLDMMVELEIPICIPLSKLRELQLQPASEILIQEALNYRVVEGTPDFISRITQVTDHNCPRLFEASITCLHNLNNPCPLYSKVKNLIIYKIRRIQELLQTIFEFTARDDLMPRDPRLREQLLGGLQVDFQIPNPKPRNLSTGIAPFHLLDANRHCLKILRSFPRHRKLSTAKFAIIPILHLPVIFSFIDTLTTINVGLCRKIQSIDELPIGLQARDANNTTSLEWIVTGSNWKVSEQLISFGCSKLLVKTSNPRRKLLKELIATDSVSVLLPGGELPHRFEYKCNGSVLSFVVPPLVKQKIRGWFLCAIFASSLHNILGFTITYELKNYTKKITWQYQQKNCRVIPRQEHLWLHFAPVLQHKAHLLEAGDEMEYSMHISSGFQVKKFGVNLIYDNDKKDYLSYFEPMIENAHLPCKDDLLDEDVTIDQTLVPEEDSDLVEVEDRPSEGNRHRNWPYFPENQPGTMFFEGGAQFEHNLCSSGISRMNSQTERLRNLEAEQISWEAERQILHHQLIETARTSSQHIIHNAALESENFRLRMELANARQFAPQLHTDLPRRHLASKSAASSS